MAQIENLTGIYLGNRGEDFKTLIIRVLKKAGDLADGYIETLTNDESMVEFGKAFTSEQVDSMNNYQVYEQLGDLSGNKFIVHYIYNKFPQLNCAEGVKVAARLKINYGSRQSFFKLADDLGFWPFISATNDIRQRKKKDLLEDVFEATLGVTEMLVDQHFGFGKGWELVYNVLKCIFDNMNISLKYEDLYDSKTRLKELFDMFGDKLGTLMYREEKEEVLNGLTTSRVYRQTPNRHKVLIGEGQASRKADAQQAAASIALVNLEKQGFKKHAPRVYTKFSDPEYKGQEVTKQTILKEIESADARDEKTIDKQLFTRGKSKYQSKYTSTVLGKYCRQRNSDAVKFCLELGADPNAIDSEKLSCLDILMIGNKEKVVKKIVKKFMKLNKNLNIDSQVYDQYLVRLYPKLPEKYSGRFNVIKNE